MVYVKTYFKCLSSSFVSACFRNKIRCPNLSPRRFNHSLNAIFIGDEDRYNGITIDCNKQQNDVNLFKKMLEDSLRVWQEKQKRCVWFKINIQNSTFVPLLAEKGFTFHHARQDFLMMYKWLPTNTTPNLPPAPHTNLGVGALVFNGKNQILAISEKHYEYPHWKLPGGYVERGEDIIDTAIREVKEETGVDSAFESLVTFRHTHNMMFGNSDMYVLIQMKALSEEIVISEREVSQCRWMDMQEYLSHPHVHDFNRLVVNKAMEYKQNDIKLDIQKKTVHWATNVRHINFLSIESYKK